MGILQWYGITKKHSFGLVIIKYLFLDLREKITYNRSMQVPCEEGVLLLSGQY